MTCEKPRPRDIRPAAASRTIIGVSVSAISAENDDRGRDREAELTEQPADRRPAGTIGTNTATSTDRRGDHREADLAAAVDRSDRAAARRLMRAVDVLEHDDRVVDDEPDREHEPEQRQHVDREPDHRHHEERRDDRDRDRDGRDQRRAHVAEEQVDHDQHRAPARSPSRSAPPSSTPR